MLGAGSHFSRSYSGCITYERAAELALPNEGRDDSVREAHHLNTVSHYDCAIRHPGPSL